MTVIVAVKTDNRIVFAHDSLATAGDRIINDNNMTLSKLWQQNNLTVAHSGQCVFDTLMRFSLKLMFRKALVKMEWLSF